MKRREGKRLGGDGKGEKEWMYSFTKSLMTYTSLVPDPQYGVSTVPRVWERD